MSRHAPGAENAGGDSRHAAEIRLASRPLGNGLAQTGFSVSDIRCGGCLRKIENAVGALDGVEFVRANLSAKRVDVGWRENGPVPPIIPTMESIGYAAHPGENDDTRRDATLRRLLQATAVAGFAAANIMLLSVSVWSGAEDATRDLFHWISALIALPALAYSGRVFFESAWSALRAGRLNMDVPISLAILLAFGMSLYETAGHGEHAYFDAAATLTFFLLIGRTLDHVMRERARSAVTGLARLSARGAVVLNDDGSRDYVETGAIEPGMKLQVSAGERIPVDGRVLAGVSEVDRSIVTGESEPAAAGTDSDVKAGTLNLTGSLTMEATAAARDSFLAEIRRLMEAAEGGRSRYRRIADRAAEIYAPAVHLAAALTFAAWCWNSGDLHRSIYTAIAVLIITCPCALGLAAPVVQVAAARRLFDAGVMVKDGGALERIAECDHVVFDKTGTLTGNAVRVANADDIDAKSLTIAASMASRSRHPYSKAIAETGSDRVEIGALRERPGYGLEATVGGKTCRLGRPEWALDENGNRGEQVVLAREGERLAGFSFAARPRADAEQSVAAVRALGLKPEILSGDRIESVKAVANSLRIDRFAGRVSPSDKIDRLAALKADGGRVLMVGDGINDAPALAAAHASMAPASAADVGRNAADFIFLRESLTAVPFTIDTARRAATLVKQNFALSALYNLVAVPAAALGHATPLVAALAMSASSIIVIANAMRLNVGGRGERIDGGAAIMPQNAATTGIPAR